jgi:hypothetical protein
MTDQSETTGQQKTPEELRGEIEETREHLGETVEQLAAKADVKARAHEKVEERKQAARDKAEHVKTEVKSKPQIPAGIVGAAVVVVALVVWRNRR